MSKGIVLANICLKKGQNTVLDGVSFSIAPGESMAITGGEGDGKSSLMRLIALIERPTSGEIMIDGEEVQNVSAQRGAALRRQEFGIALQHLHLVPELTALQNIKLAVDIQNPKATEKVQRSKQALALFGIEEKANTPVFKLSTGEQRRVALARAIVNLPPIILLDEPTLGLDANIANELIKTLFTLHETHEFSLIIATHALGISHITDRQYDFQQARQLR